MILSGGESMEYTVQKLGKMAGISARALRYYDEKQPGTAAFLRDAVLINTGTKK